MTLKNNKFLFLNILFYSFLNIILSFKNPSLSPIFKSIFWLLTNFYLIFSLQKTYYPHLHTKKYLIPALTIELLSLFFIFLLGLKIGFTKSPFAHDFSHLLSNFFTYFIPLIGIETTRYILASKPISKSSFIFLVIFFILTEINYPSLILNLSNKELFFKYLTQSLIPIIFKNILFTTLSPKISLATLLILSTTSTFLSLITSIIPNLDWFSLGTTKLLKYFLIFFTFKYYESPKPTSYIHHYPSFITYVLSILSATILICFMLGIFSYKPIAIKSNSMHPIFNRGDIIIYKKITKPEGLTPNSIIVFKNENSLIVHRLIKITKINNTYEFTTKGDNNNTPDSQILQFSSILGIYQFKIKYLGYPSIWLNDYLKS